MAACVLGLTLLGSGTAMAANPNWVVGHGAFGSEGAASGASTNSVAAGNRVGFFEWLRNDDTSNISQLFATATTSPTAAVFGGNWTIRDANGGLVRGGTCPVATPLLCSFGALNSGQTVYIVVAFTIGSNVADNTTENVTFQFNTTGTPGGKNNSHGDAKNDADSVLVSKNGDANGDFNLDQPDLTVSDNQTLSPKNPQATSATAAGIALGIAVGDSPSLTIPCNATLLPGFDCTQLTSLVSAVEVGNGRTFNNPNGAGTPGIKVIVSFKKAPSQLGGQAPFAYHYFTDAAGVGHAELITATCTMSGGFPSNVGPCLVVNNNVITVWLTHNGGLRM